jgi:CRP-like cAMP-binding protein
VSFFQDQKILNKSPLQQKVAHLLLELLEKYSAESDGILPIPLTRREIADSLGSTVESVIRIMSDWSRQGIIQTTEHHIEILEPDKVVQILKEGE